MAANTYVIDHNNSFIFVYENPTEEEIHELLIRFEKLIKYTCTYSKNNQTYRNRQFIASTQYMPKEVFVPYMEELYQVKINMSTLQQDYITLLQ